MDTNMNVEKYIDMNTVNEILDGNRGKKIVFFGGGTASDILYQKIGHCCKIEYIVDNNQVLWGKSYNHTKIYNPNILANEKNGQFIIFINSQHSISIGAQLTKMELKENIDFFDIYSTFEVYFRLKKSIMNQKKLIDFIEKIEPQHRKENEVNTGKKIGIVVWGRIKGNSTWFDIALFLLLKHLGYNVSLIIYPECASEDFAVGKGASEAIASLIHEVIIVLRNKFSGLDIRYIEDGKAQLDSSDIEEIKRLAKVNTVWQRAYESKKIEKVSDEVLEHFFYEMLYNNTEKIKCFFENNKFDIINIQTAIQYDAGIFMWIGKKNKIRVSNYDGYSFDSEPLWATNAPCTHSEDIEKIILQNKLSCNEKERIIEKAKTEFTKNINTCINPIYQIEKIVSFQTIRKEECEPICYDIVIPLNVMWDAAALGLERLFTSTGEWLRETIEYVVKHTKYSIAIREHPSEIFLKDYNNYSYAKEIEKIFGKTDRIRVIRNDEKVNTYLLVEHCKLVIPLSTTLGVESAILRKRVLTHSNCFYNKMSFVTSACTKEDYFEKIRTLEEIAKPNEKQLKEAYLTYYLLMNRRAATEFRETESKWLEMTLDEICCLDGVDKIVKNIAENIPICISNVEDMINNNFESRCSL